MTSHILNKTSVEKIVHYINDRRTYIPLLSVFSTKNISEKYLRISKIKF